MKPRAFVGRRFFQMTAMIVIGIGSLLILKKLGYLDLRPVAEAFRREGHWIGLIVLSLTGLLTLSAIRFFYLVRGLGIDAPFREVLGTNLVGQAVGQWLPGSMAMTEVLRFGVMAGLRPKGDSGRISAGPGPLGRLGLAILVDRLLGLGAMFALGGLAGFYLLIRKSLAPEHVLIVAALSAISLTLGFTALAGPFRPNRFLLRLAGRLAGDAPVPKGIFRRMAGKVLQLFRSLEELRSGGIRPSRFLLLSLVAAVLNPLTLYFASVAAGTPLPFPVILAAIPYTVAAIFLPSGIAGFGGPQLLSAGVFLLFGAEPEIVVPACLLQNTVVLAAQTVGGALGIALISSRAALRPGKRG